ncbi:parathyroid hormone 2 receptor isoform X3 [Cephus cinctus]|uniref:Parathyroid hormone 2 receptor isoform X3 n=1 Tax=Cephus cinctus TaxID=211228 RepID=A0AAJ7RJ74_CEPCN|nr:parathyroid hormone 2 receptor isoform X3 [Cephus cinctus]XP_024941949.1 parathyroid hormone 2 receptor isoform X3 [Cephus cinctus]
MVFQVNIHSYLFYFLLCCRMVQNIFDSYVAEQKSRCEHLLSLENNNNTTGVRCPPSFDRLLCWPSTGASETAILPCPPSFAFGYNPKNATASKICLSSGRWYKNLDGVTWSNYSQCRPPRDEYVTAIADITELSNRTNYGPDGNLDLVNKWLSVIKTVSQIGYASSFTTLVIALVIFSFLRKLRNSRNRLHKHLFVSFIMRAFMALLKDWLFVGGVGLAWDVVAVDGKGVFIKEHNTWICKAITSVWQYFIVANYAWILMEGLYLHNLVFLAFCSDTTAITLTALYRSYTLDRSSHHTGRHIVLDNAHRSIIILNNTDTNNDFNFVQLYPVPQYREGPIGQIEDVLADATKKNAVQKVGQVHPCTRTAVRRPLYSFPWFILSQGL